ncbi:MAG: hypothetical protein DI556_01105 [Rhodovulum sulfidophilum]|uniref:DUF192 domain-containing protein n=1 Tax=Rhodovulum sulfidophilum TaxID=35806 RepID=A0A2W5Q4L0_RHOSU|nr:MAG: hypothetical protein DI556_01105 [Rhodovulum sulfidophilum]
MSRDSGRRGIPVSERSFVPVGVFRRLALAALLIGLGAGSAAAADGVCDPTQVDIRDADGSARVTVEVVDTPATRERGLMFRESMPRYSGMLFVYEYPQPVYFWMENTLIPLDMLFFDASGRLERIHENAVPHDRTPIPGGQDIRFVLELNAGMAKTLDIEPGAELRHPAVDQAIAAWPCG